MSEYDPKSIQPTPYRNDINGGGGGSTPTGPAGGVLIGSYPSPSGLAATGVPPGSYTNTNVTVAIDGRVSAISNGTSGGLPTGTAGGVLTGNYPNPSGLTPTGVSAGSYTNANVTIAADGRVLSAASGVSGPSSLPVGTLLDYAGTTAPTGFLLCDGSTVSRTTFNALFLIAGTMYGVGDGTTTFNLPDFRGRFARYADDMGGIPAGRDVGVRDVTLAQTQSTAANGIVTSLAGAHTHTANVYDSISAPYNDFYGGHGADQGPQGITNSAGAHTHTLVDPIGAETRPINVRCYKIIKT